MKSLKSILATLLFCVVLICIGNHAQAQVNKLQPKTQKVDKNKEAKYKVKDKTYKKHPAQTYQKHPSKTYSKKTYSTKGNKSDKSVETKSSDTSSDNNTWRSYSIKSISGIGTSGGDADTLRVAPTYIEEENDDDEDDN